MRIAQITDLHARHHLPGTAVQGRRESRLAFEILPAVLADVAAWEPDLLAVTGDLLDVPLCLLHPSDYYRDPVEAWRPLARADFEKLKGLLDAGGMRYTVLPGNHDLESEMWQVFDPEPRVFDLASASGAFRIFRFYDREWDHHIPKRLDRERRLFDRAMREARPGSPRQVHLQHYLVSPPVEADYPYNYLEADELRERMVAAGVCLSLSGHYHDGVPLERVGGTRFATGPVFGQFPFTVSLYEIDAHGAVREERRPYEHLHPLRPITFVDEALLRPEGDVVFDPETVAVRPGAATGIRGLHAQGHRVIAVSNHPEVGQGYLTWKDLQTAHELLCHRLAEDAGDPSGQPDHMVTWTRHPEAVVPEWRDGAGLWPSPHLFDQAMERHRGAIGSRVITGDPRIEAAAQAAGLPVLGASALFEI